MCPAKPEGQGVKMGCREVISLDVGDSFFQNTTMQNKYITNLDPWSLNAHLLTKSSITQPQALALLLRSLMATLISLAWRRMETLWQGQTFHGMRWSMTCLKCLPAWQELAYSRLRLESIFQSEWYLLIRLRGNPWFLKTNASGPDRILSHSSPKTPTATF